MFRIPKEENHQADMVAKFVVFKIAKILMNVFIKVAEVQCTERILVGAIEEREYWRTLIL